MTDKRKLKQKAHSLKPVVMTGSNGLTQNVLNEIERALFDHELIKIKINELDREERQLITQKICEYTQAELIQSIGKTITIYRERVEPK